MREDAAIRDVPARLDIADEADHGVDLIFRKGWSRRRIGVGLHAFRQRLGLAVGAEWPPEIMPRMGDLDADGGGIHIRFAAPGAATRMPGATALGHQLEDTAILENEVMRRDLCNGVCEPEKCRTRIRHARVMQDDAVRRAQFAAAPTRPRAMVGRGEEARHMRLSGLGSGSFMGQAQTKMAGCPPPSSLRAD